MTPVASTAAVANAATPVGDFAVPFELNIFTQPAVSAGTVSVAPIDVAATPDTKVAATCFAAAS